MPVRPDLLADVWPVVAPMLAPAVARAAPLWRIEDMPDAIVRRVFDLWLVTVEGRPKAAALTRIEHYPGATVLDVPFVGGSGLREWLRPLDEALTAWGRQNGASVMMGGGRHGWRRLLGFRLWNPTFLREI